MVDPASVRTTQLLALASQGDARATDELLALVYDELATAFPGGQHGEQRDLSVLRFAKGGFVPMKTQPSDVDHRRRDP